MKEIPQDIIDDVNKITNEIIIYKNKKNLSWTKVYKEVLKNLNMKDKIEDDRILTNVITKITRLGYDIEAIPFKLNKFI